MPVIIENSEYSNAFGYTGNTYVSNAGDVTTLELTVAEQIRVSTLNNPFTFDPLLYILTSPAVSWLDEGIRSGDLVYIARYTASGNLSHSHTATVTSVTDTELNVDSWVNNLFYDIGAGDLMVVTPVVSVGGAVRRREDLLLEFNHSLNNQAGSPSSLIDGELTRSFFSNLSALGIGGTQSGAIVGNESGQFLQSTDIEYLGTNADGFNQYTITFVFANSGIYDQEWFALGNCLKIFVRGLWSSKVGEVFDRVEFTYDNQANTGWFNEANNVSIATGGSVVNTFAELEYNVSPNTVSFEVDLAGTNIADLAMGGAYVSNDDAYYKNQVYNQENLTYLLPTTTIVATNTYTSNSGVGSYSGANWEITVNSITPSGGNAIINLDWSCNSSLQTFFESRDADDRLFYLWVKIGNTNHLVYSNQLTKELPVGGALTMNSDYGFLDHSQNTTSIAGDHVGFVGDTEDDIAYYGTFNLELNKQTYNSINLRVEAFNTVSEDKFTLQQTNFSFGGVTYQSSTGKYLLNETSTINTELPTTSNKKDARVTLTGNDTLTTYEVAVYYPFLLNWKYWLPLEGVSTDFAPNENQNWEQYDNTGNWTIRMVVELDDGGLAFIHENTLIDNPYNNNADVTTTIELQRQSDNSVVNIIPEGEQLFIESTHVLTTGNWDVQKIWGMITVEPKEGAPRWISSTIVAYDNNSNNPLTPISGLLCQISYISATTIKLKCKFDPNKLDTTNGVKITAKIKQVCDDIVEVNKITTDDEDKLTTDDDEKILA
jgi:hypothetical protein